MSAVGAGSMLEVVGVSRYYGLRPAVQGLTFRLEAGEIVGLVGLNGAGKSTTLRMLAGLTAPTEGEIRLRGHPLRPGSHGLRASIGFLPDRPPLYEAMTVHGYLCYAAELRGLAAGRVASGVARALAACGLKDAARERIGWLSHGFRQRVGMAQAIVHDPALVILDEPGQGLDPVQRAAMRRLIRELAARHTVVFSTHLLAEVRECCDRVLILHGGRLCGDGREADVVRHLAPRASHAMAVVARGSREQIAAALSRVPGLGPYVVRPGGDAYHLRIEGESDLRAAVASALVEAGAELCELGSVEDGLEAVLAALVERAPEAQ